MAYLTIRDETRHILDSKTEWTMGRSQVCDILIQDPMVSRQHARIYRNNSILFVVDMNSRNGTFLNGRRVTSTPSILQNNDVINIGNTTVKVNLEAENPVSPKVIEGDSTNVSYTKKLVTVLFLDIRDYTALSQRVDEEVLAPIISDWHRFNGHLAITKGAYATKSIGDALMAAWCHEDEPASEIRKVLETVYEITEYSSKLNKDYPFLKFDFGVGINTGEAMVGNNGSGDQDFTPLGDTVNAASRYQDSTRLVGCDMLLGKLSAHYLGIPLKAHQLQIRGYDKPHVLYSVSREQLRELVSVTDLRKN